MLRWKEGSWEELCKNGRMRNVLLPLPWIFLLTAGRRCYMAVATSRTETRYKHIRPKTCVQIPQGSSRDFTGGVAGVAEPSVEGLSP